MCLDLHRFERVYAVYGIVSSLVFGVNVPDIKLNKIEQCRPLKKTGSVLSNIEQKRIYL